MDRGGDGIRPDPCNNAQLFILEVFLLGSWTKRDDYSISISRHPGPKTLRPRTPSRFQTYQCHEAILSIIFKAPPANKKAAAP